MATRLARVGRRSEDYGERGDTPRSPFGFAGGGLAVGWVSGLLSLLRLLFRAF